MTEKKEPAVDVVMKALAWVEPAETDNPHGAFDVILSAPTLDRDGEVIDSRAFDPLPDHIPFDIDHSMTVTGTVGSGTPYYDTDGTLRVKGTFASTALGQEVRTLVTEGHIRTTSVTFISGKRTKDATGVDHVTKAELLNGTFTPVPSNREALVLSAKAATVTDGKAGARNSTADLERIQSAHDHMAALGASCAAMRSIKAVTEDATDPSTAASALDAAIDAAIASVEGLDQAAWPVEVQTFYNLVQAADAAADELLDALGLPDPDEDTPTKDATDSAAAKAAALSAASTEEDLTTKAMLAQVENAAQLAF